jgi:hypothetical protein
MFRILFFITFVYFCILVLTLLLVSVLLSLHVNKHELNLIIVIIIIIIINFYVCMYVYSPFSPHNGITTGNVLILLFSPINVSFNFPWNYY